MGNATKDSSGTFMLKEGSDQPYIVYIPGFRGYISTRFTADPEDWRDHVIFNNSMADIQSLIIEGGAKTINTFIKQELWDEIRVETNLRLTVSSGTRAPQVPANASIISCQQYDDNQIVLFSRTL